MNQFQELMNDSIDFAIEEFGVDDQNRRYLLVIAGKKIPIVQNNLPRQSNDLSAGYALYGAGEILCRKADILVATGGVLPKLESHITLIVEGESEGQSFKIGNVETSHGDPGMIITLEIA